MNYAPTTIDLSRVAAPQAIEVLDADAYVEQFLDRFVVAWEEERLVDPSLPIFDVASLKANPAARFARVFSYLRLLDRGRVNDALKSVLAPLAKGTNLDNIVARQNVQRLVIRPATDTDAAVMESDAALLRRYLLSFDNRSAGSRDRYLYEAWTAWPEMLDCRVNGYGIHGRRGDTDIVIIGPGGRLPTPEEKALVRAAVKAPHVKPEAVSVSVVDATRLVYDAELVIEIPTGPDAELVRQEALERVTVAAASRILIGGEIPPGYLAGTAYGPSVIRVRDNAPVVIEAEPYTVPVPGTISVAVEVRS